jgi:hypothetical protein
MDSITESPYPVCFLGPDLPKSASFGSLLAFDLADLGTGSWKPVPGNRFLETGPFTHISLSACLSQNHPLGGR